MGGRYEMFNPQRNGKSLLLYDFNIPLHIQARLSDHVLRRSDISQLAL